MPAQSIDKLLMRLWAHIAPRRRSQFGLLLLLMILTSFSEILSIGAVLPFLAILTDPKSVFELSAAKPVVEMLGLTEPKQILLHLTIAFGLAAIFAGAMRLLLLWGSTRLSYSTGADLSISIYRRTLYQPYAVHFERNSSEIINGIASKTSNSIYLINMTLNLVSSSLMLVAILVVLLAVEPFAALAAFGGLGLLYALVIYMTRRRLLINSQIVARESTHVIKSLQEGLGGIRDVLIEGSQEAYCEIYRKADQPLRRAQGNTSFINYSPRYGMEALGMVMIAVLAYAIAQQEGGVAKAVPLLGALALGAQRLLPVLQQGYSSWSSIRGGQISLQDTLNLLDQPLPDWVDLPDLNPISFRQQVSLKQISFRYSPEAPWVFTNLDLTFSKGSRVGIIGVTGSGKSTLLDIVMGLLDPTSGVIQVDNQTIVSSNRRAWQAHIAHVPQVIFLTDSTIEENIAFGVPRDKIDRSRVFEAAKQAQIADVIESWPEQYQTVVGERGVRLSGGQRQRIGIARALYKKVDVIIFDEATSALDNQTEQSVMQVIESLSSELTLLIIAHRLTTLKNCTQIVELGACGIKRIGTYEGIISRPAQTCE